MFSYDIEDGFAAAGSDAACTKDNGGSIVQTRTRRKKRPPEMPENIESDVGWNKLVWLKDVGLRT